MVVLRIHPVLQQCADAIQLTYHAQCFVDVKEKHTAGMSTPDGLVTDNVVDCDLFEV